MNATDSESVAQAFLPVSAEGRTTTWSDTGVSAAWTVTAVGALIVLGMAINQVGVAAKLPYACWQLTGARAAASTAVLGTLVSLRRGNLLLFGVLYGAWLLTMHSNAQLVGSAVGAGVVAWIVSNLVSNRSLVIRLISTTLAFNVVLTASGLIKAMSGSASITLGGWAGGVGLRAIATLVVVGVFALIASRRNFAASNAR